MPKTFRVLLFVSGLLLYVYLNIRQIQTQGIDEQENNNRKKKKRRKKVADIKQNREEKKSEKMFFNKLSFQVLRISNGEIYVRRKRCGTFIITFKI